MRPMQSFRNIVFRGTVCAGLVLVTLGLAWPGTAWATNVLMEELPMFSRNRCLNCHTVQDPSSNNADLNVFGDAFKDNGNRWDELLAQGNADGDACTNGFELGDQNGDGEPDNGILEERKDVWLDDCTLEIEQSAWSALKELFRP